jgi:pimeloyl-ACP methyl ester carboxylesterase
MEHHFMPISRRAAVETVLALGTLAGLPVASPQSGNVRPFKVSVPPARIEEIKTRVRNARLPKPMNDDSWDTGMSVRWLKGLQEYWVSEYDWEKAQRWLNRHPQFLATIQGIDIHFYHVKGEGPAPMPLVLTHGWPGSVVEFIDFIDPLTNPSRHGGRASDAFTLVVPSLPGYGWSSMPAHPIQARSAAPIWNTLLTEVLGYKRYGAQGGDIGALFTSQLAYQFPDQVIGAHFNLLPWPQPRPDELNPETRQWIATGEAYMAAQFDYLKMQTNKPLMPAVALVDSPLGTAAWIAEKFWSWSDNHGDLSSVVSKDTLLTNIMLYLLGPGGIDGSFWFYRAIRDELHWNFWPGYVKPPVAYAQFPKDYPMGKMPLALMKRGYNLQRLTPMPRGGHFAAIEQPDLLRNDITEFFRGLRA